MGTTDQKITTFLMFEGNAQNAMNFYTSVFDQSENLNGVHQENGMIMQSTFTIK